MRAPCAGSIIVVWEDLRPFRASLLQAAESATCLKLMAMLDRFLPGPPECTNGALHGHSVSSFNTSDRHPGKADNSDRPETFPLYGHFFLSLSSLHRNSRWIVMCCDRWQHILWPLSVKQHAATGANHFDGSVCVPPRWYSVRNLLLVFRSMHLSNSVSFSVICITLSKGLQSE